MVCTTYIFCPFSIRMYEFLLFVSLKEHVSKVRIEVKQHWTISCNNLLQRTLIITIQVYLVLNLMVTKRQLKDVGQIMRPAASIAEILGILVHVRFTCPEFSIFRGAPGRKCAIMDFTHRRRSSTVEFSQVLSVSIVNLPFKYYGLTGWADQLVTLRHSRAMECSLHEPNRKCAHLQFEGRSVAVITLELKSEDMR